MTVWHTSICASTMDSNADGMTPALITIVVMPFIVLTIAFCIACRSSYKSESRPIQDIVDIMRTHKVQNKKDQQS